MFNSNKTKTADTGLRGNFRGELYIDKKVFFNRPEVIERIDQLKNSETLKKQLAKSRK